jgi:hypothetical protein
MKQLQQHGKLRSMLRMPGFLIFVSAALAEDTLSIPGMAAMPPSNEIFPVHGLCNAP